MFRSKVCFLQNDWRTLLSDFVSERVWSNMYLKCFFVECTHTNTRQRKPRIESSTEWKETRASTINNILLDIMPFTYINTTSKLHVNWTAINFSSKIYDIFRYEFPLRIKVNSYLKGRKRRKKPLETSVSS